MIQGLTHRLPGVLPGGDFFCVIEEVRLPSGGEGHLPAWGQRQLVCHVVGLLAEVRVLLRGAGRSARTGAQLQGCGRGMRADVLRAAGQPRPGVAARRVGTGLPRVRARVGLLEEGLRQDLLPPRAGLGVHDRVEEGLEVCVEVLRDVDHLLPGRRERWGRRGRIHLLGAQRSRARTRGGRRPAGAGRRPESPGYVRSWRRWSPAPAGKSRLDLVPGRRGTCALTSPEPASGARAWRQGGAEAADGAVTAPPELSHKQSLKQTPTPRKEAGPKVELLNYA